MDKTTNKSIKTRIKL